RLRRQWDLRALASAFVARPNVPPRGAARERPERGRYLGIVPRRRASLDPSGRLGVPLPCDRRTLRSLLLALAVHRERRHRGGEASRRRRDDPSRLVRFRAPLPLARPRARGLLRLPRSPRTSSRLTRAAHLVFSWYVPHKRAP